MSDGVPRELAELLERLGRADAGKVRAVEARVRQLGRDLPQFQSVWVDALAQTRLITSYQATEINAGRGERLRVGPFALQTKGSSLGYARWFDARDVDSGKRASLIVVEASDDKQADELANSVGQLTSRAGELSSRGVCPVLECGRAKNRIWGAIPVYGMRAAAEHLVRHGRMPPSAVMEISRQMAEHLVHQEAVGFAHGDVSVSTLMLGRSGSSLLIAPGLRPIVRPAEGFGHTDLLPEYYDSLAPEQIDGGAAPDALTDLYGCGCVWWHLLTGRPCFPGGDALSKLQAHLTMVPGDVRELAPDVPEQLAEAIGACVAKDRRQRPGSASELAKQLGPSTPAGRAELARWMKPSGGVTPIHIPSSGPHSGTRPAWPLAAAGIALLGFTAVLIAIGLPSRSARDDRNSAASQPPVTSPGDSQQEPAGPEPPEAKPTPESSGDSNEWELSASGPVTLDTSRLAAGMRVSGPPGGRATVLVRGTPLHVAHEDILFERIDFVWQSDTTGTPPGEIPAILQLEAGRIRFRQCTFQAAAGQARNCVAIRWVFPIDRGGLSLPTGKASLKDCVFHHLDAAVDARTAAALTIECENVLHLDSGPLVRLDHAPPVDEPLGLAFTNVTLREAGAVLEIRKADTVDRPGTVSINAQLCVFEPRTGGALLSFDGAAAPDALARAVYWTGEGALVAPGAGVAHWVRPSGPPIELNDAAFSIAGLVRGQVEFAGPAEPRPASNVARRWQAPLATPEAPGIRAASLPEPPK